MIKKIQILLVEDNPGDVILTKENFAHYKILQDLHVATDGAEALDFLYKRGKHKDAPRPDLVLLDLNLPKVNGQEVLAEMKQDANLRSIPVVVLTSSAADEDIARSYDLQASAYVAKPVDLAAFGKIVKAINDFWLTIVRYPEQPAG